ncbi:unnamed protein product [Trichobilharzia szidati]|nr:unnamed protein product [Trichobilharzia szidati]
MKLFCLYLVTFLTSSYAFIADPYNNHRHDGYDYDSYFDKEFDRSFLGFYDYSDDYKPRDDFYDNTPAINEGHGNEGDGERGGAGGEGGGQNSEGNSNGPNEQDNQNHGPGHHHDHSHGEHNYDYDDYYSYAPSPPRHHYYHDNYYYDQLDDDDDDDNDDDQDQDQDHGNARNNNNGGQNNNNIRTNSSHRPPRRHRYHDRYFYRYDRQVKEFVFDGKPLYVPKRRQYNNYYYYPGISKVEGFGIKGDIYGDQINKTDDKYDRYGNYLPDYQNVNIGPRPQVGDSDPRGQDNNDGHRNEESDEHFAAGEAGADQQREIREGDNGEGMPRDLNKQPESPPNERGQRQNEKNENRKKNDRKKDKKKVKKDKRKYYRYNNRYDGSYDDYDSYDYQSNDNGKTEEDEAGDENNSQDEQTTEGDE